MLGRPGGKLTCGPLGSCAGWAPSSPASSSSCPRTDPTPETPTITWTFDAAGRSISRAYLDDAGNPRTTSYAYDLAGDLLSAIDGTSAITVTSDRLGRPLSVSETGDTGATTTYTYSFTAPARTDASGAYTLAVDPLGHLTSLTDPIHVTPFAWAGADMAGIARPTSPRLKASTMSVKGRSG
jgi:hypothetical protein